MAQGERPRSFIAALEPDRCASSTHSSRSFASSVVSFFYASPPVSVASTSLPPRDMPTLSTASPVCFLLRLLLFAINLAQTAWSSRKRLTSHVFRMRAPASPGFGEPARARGFCRTRLSC